MHIVVKTLGVEKFTQKMCRVSQEKEKYGNWQREYLRGKRKEELAKC